MMKRWLLCCTAIACLIVMKDLYTVSRHAITRYQYIPTENMFKEMMFRRVTNSNSNFKNCSYYDIILNNMDLDGNSISTYGNYRKPLKGGEFTPTDCAPLIKTALVIPYRNRPEQLNLFLNYMHYFLQQQMIHYRIFIVDQNDTLPFNRAKMLNYGAKFAIALNYDCLILHDIDLIPLNTGNLYGCTRLPRHMSCNVNTFRFNLPYLEISGGVVAILARQYQTINGMSNLFYGWGGEDDDFYRRMIQHGLAPYRFPPEFNKYTMLLHKKEKPSENRINILNTIKGKSEKDGLNSLSELHSVQYEDLYTHLCAS